MPLSRRPDVTPARSRAAAVVESWFMPQRTKSESKSRQASRSSSKVVGSAQYERIATSQGQSREPTAQASAPPHASTRQGLAALDVAKGQLS